MVALLASPLARGQAVADFSQGVGTASASHQFVGTAGEGWLGPWATFTENATLNTSVLNTNPIIGTENYLQMSFEGGASASRRTALNRQFNTSLAQAAHTISFSIRFDNLTGLGSNDFIGIFATNNAVTNTTSTSVQTWGMIVTGSSGALSFRAGPDASDTVQTGVTIAEGVTYSFVLNIDPANNAWQGNVASSDDDNFSSGSMGYRNNSTTGQTININTLMNSPDDQWTYSLSGLTVIPEPATTALLGGLGVLLLVPLLRKRFGRDVR